MSSFVSYGHPFFLYSYGKIDDVPEGVQLCDARDITSEDNVDRFIIKGKGNLSHFSDLFRYKLFQTTEHAWVDLDMLALKPIDLPATGDLLAKEDAKTLCGAIMRVDSWTPALATLVERTEALRDREMPWGATGPRLLTDVLGRKQTFDKAFGSESFFPVHYADSWKLLLPAFRDECESLCKNAYTVHLWNDRVMKVGVWKKFGPPKGSFLQQHFSATGCDRYFEDVYPEHVMQSMVENWRIRCEGGDIGLGQWLRLAIPSARLTYRRRLNLPT